MGLAEHDLLQFAIYPNPVKDILNIKTNDLTNSKFEIRDLTGSVILKGNAQSGKINVNHLQKGIYILTFEQNGKKSNTKFVK